MQDAYITVKRRSGFQSSLMFGIFHYFWKVTGTWCLYVLYCTYNPIPKVV